MLELDVTEQEFYDSDTQMFLYTKPFSVKLEHSLISISKWEAIWKKPYLPNKLIDSGPNTRSEEASYILCMTIGKLAEENLPILMLHNNKKVIVDYIADGQTATTIKRENKWARPQIITSELIYYWMLKFGIPFECDRWNFNRLLTLIDVCSIKEDRGKGSKISHMEAAAERQRINTLRKAEMGIG